MTAPTPATETAPAPAPRPQGRRRSLKSRASGPTWIIAFLGFFLLCGGWALAAPYDGSPDEMQHIIRAVGVARGEIAPTPTAAASGTGAFQDVPASLLQTNCWAFQPAQSADCATPPGGDQHIAKTPTRAGRYNPVYYALVGWPIALWPTMKGVLIARLVSAALTAAFLAAAANGAVRWTRHRVMAAGLLAAVTPITVSLAGAINPNGLEIAAGAALFCALIPATLSSDAPVGRATAVQIALAGATLVTLRALGPLWALAIFGVLLIPIAPRRLGTLARSRGFRRAVLAIILVGGAAAAWTVLMKAGELAPVGQSEGLTVSQTLRFELMGRLPGYLTELIGIPSWLDTVLPGQFYLLWQLVLGALLIPAFALGTWGDRWRMALITVGALSAAIVPEVMNVNKYGFATQGRYILPLMVGLPILAAWLLGHRGILDPARGDRLTRVVALVVLPLHLVFLSFTMVRWQAGTTIAHTRLPLNPLLGSWHPIVGSVNALASAVLGCLALLLWVLVSTRRGTRSTGELA